MKKEFLQKVIPVLSLLLALVCTACSGKESGNPEKLLLSLNFDEGSGNQVSDGAGQAQPAEVKYLFTNAAYMDARSPEWRSQGVSGGCLLFDGCSNYIGYEPEELLVQNITGGSIGRCCIFPESLETANVNQHVSIIRVDKRVFLPEFMHYYWISPLGSMAISLYQTGGNREGMSAEAIKNTPIILMPLGEQKRICKVLDVKCAEIDAVLDKTRTSIEEYKKLKQAIITQAVTKGIRGDRSMKESGIVWLDTVPADWTISKIKHTIFSHEKPVLPTDDVITCFRDGMVTLRKNRREEGFAISFTEHGYQGVDVGDLVIHGMDTFAGAIGCSDSRGKTSPVVHVCSTVGNNRYFMYFLRYMAYSNVLMDFSNGVRIRSSDFRNFNKLGVFEILIPPLEEQNEIVDYLDNEILEIEQMINKKEQFLMEVEFYKKSMIYEYITGKKEAI